MAEGKTTGPLSAVIERLRNPFLLYGLGSVLVLAAVIASVVTEVNRLILGAAVLLLLCAMAIAGLLAAQRNRVARNRITRKGFNPEITTKGGIEVDDSGELGSQTGDNLGDSFNPRITARDDIKVSGTGMVGSYRSQPKPGKRKRKST